MMDLLLALDNAEDYGLEHEEIKNDYWKHAKRDLSTALAITQQGVELVLKGKIAKVSPFLLIAGEHNKWPSPYKNEEIDFSQFRTIDAQDLIRVHDTISESKIAPEFVELFNKLRLKRNSILHSVDKNLVVNVTEVLDSLLFMHKTLFPDETWAKVRCGFLEKAPDIELGSIDYVKNSVCREMSIVYKILPSKKLKKYFNISKKQHLYICPNCFDGANNDWDDFDYKLAILKPKGPKSINLYCPVCDAEHLVIRKKCSNSDCKSNVISDEYGICLLCLT